MIARHKLAFIHVHEIGFEVDQGKFFSGVYRFDAEYARFLLTLAGKIMFLVSAIGLIYFGPRQLQKIVRK